MAEKPMRGFQCAPRTCRELRGGQAPAGQVTGCALRGMTGAAEPPRRAFSQTTDDDVGALVASVDARDT